MTRRPAFWIILILLFIGGIFFSINFFDKANPIVNLDISMDREAALASAQGIAKKYNLGPENFKTAASFSLDDDVKNYVELEIGGASAFNSMIAGDLFSPYTWKVRHFKPEETNETMIRFTPSGEFYGFAEKLPEDQPGQNLSADSALAIAEKKAINAGIKLNDYELVENSQEVMSGGRKDYTFVYERKDKQLKEAAYRLRLKLSGSKFTELTHFVKIPEAFSRKYDEMRSTNETLAMIATVAGAILYVLGGVILGLFLLLRHNWVVWKPAIFWGFFIAILMALLQINNWPLMWMSYDTAIAAQGFLMQQIVQLLILFLAEFLLLTLSFMAAESLSRKAFPEHIQLWRIWSKDVANTKPVYGQTFGGYLGVSIFLGFDVALYFFTTRVLGWWVPSSTLFNPNILATHMPWFASIVQSLHAGFWEECLFRAIPIAGAALIGQKYGRRNWWIAAAFVVQALIFGAAHANYPMQPSYARVVELIIPSLAFGLVYLYFGLLPGIILHFAYDVVWFSLPLFASSAEGLFFDKLMVITLTFVPVIILIWRRLQTGKTVQLQEKYLNKSWQPSETVTNEIEPAKSTASSGEFSERLKYGIILLGAITFIGWLIIGNFRNHATRLDTTRLEAESLALQTIQKRGIELSDTMEVLSTVQTPLDTDDRFIWQEYGEETYRELSGTYLRNPLWLVRFARFEGSVDQRAEEYLVYIEKGEVIRFRHKLPESTPGDSLPEYAARKIALNHIKKQYAMNSASFQEITASPSKHPARTDWLFEYEDTTNVKLDKEGKALISVKVAGSQIVDSYQKVEVPEKWERAEKSRTNSIKIIKIVSVVFYVFLFIAAIIVAIVFWSKGKFTIDTFLPVLITMAVVLALSFINSWPKLMAQLNTALPMVNQKTIFAISGFFTILMAFVPALIFGFINDQKEYTRSNKFSLNILFGISIGLLMFIISALLEKLFSPSLAPNWAEYGSLGDHWPLFSKSLDVVPGFFMKSSEFLFVFWLIDRLTKNWQVKKPLAGLLFLIMGFVITGLTIETIPYWVISGLVMGVIYYLLYTLLIRKNIYLAILITIGYHIPTLFRGMLMNAYPVAILENILALIVLLMVGVLVYRKVVRE